VRERKGYGEAGCSVVAVRLTLSAAPDYLGVRVPHDEARSLASPFPVVNKFWPPYGRRLYQEDCVS
jgi:hypothetical protein